MSAQTQIIALMSRSLPLEGAAGAPEWIHLLPAPADGLVRTGDKRGPYTMAGFAEIIAASFRDRPKIEIDINHATYLAAPRGERADAVGWITQMQARDDGLWGRVDWTEEGRRLVTGQVYRGISPVVIHDAAKRITALSNASLVNRPNLRGLTALNFQSTEDPEMTFTERMAELLGLDGAATEEQVLDAVRAAARAPEAPALQSAILEIGTALGVDGDTAAIVAAAQQARAAQPAEIVALQAEVATLTSQLNTVTEGQSREKATAFVDAEIRRGRAGLKPVRDRYIALHMRDAPEAVALIEAMPVLGASGITLAPPAPADGTIALNAEQIEVAAHLGITTDAYLATLKAEKEAR